MLLLLFFWSSNAFHVYQEIEDSWYFLKANQSKSSFDIKQFKLIKNGIIQAYLNDEFNNKFEMNLKCFEGNVLNIHLKQVEGLNYFERYEYHFKSELNTAPFQIIELNDKCIAYCGVNKLEVTNSYISVGSLRIDNLFFKSVKQNNQTSVFNNHVDQLKNGFTSTGFVLNLNKTTKMYGFPRHTQFELFPSKTPYRLFNVDPFGYNLTSPNSLTGSIPFVLMNSEGEWNGIHINNPTEQFLIVTENSLKSITESGVIDITLFINSAPLEIVSNNMKLTGRQQIPPRWIFGYQQAAEWYTSNSTIEGAINSFYSLKIPFDSIWLSPRANFDFQSYSINIVTTFEYIQKVLKKNIKLVYTSVPFIRTSLLNETTSLLKGIFLVNGTLDHCICYNVRWIDFTDKRGFDWNVKMAKISPILTLWADYNEPAAYFSNEMTLFRDSQHQKHEHRELHNCYSNLHVQSLFEGVKQTSEYPFVLSTGFYSGIQRFGGVVLTQTTANWENLYSVLREVLSMSISGVSFVGSETGGYYENASPQLYLRWLQMQSFLPIFRGNSDLHEYRREPFMFINNQGFIKFSFSLRYQFIDYWHSSFYRTHFDDIPVIRPLFLNYPNDKTTYSIDTEWMINNDLLLCGVFNETNQIKVYLPQDVWYNYLVDERIISNGSWIEMNLDYEFIPLFVRGGTVILLKKSKTNTTTSQLKQPYTIHIYLDENETATMKWYWAIGKEQNEDYLEMNIQYKNKELSFGVEAFDYTRKKIEVDGRFKNYLRCADIIIYGLKTVKPKHVYLAAEKKKKELSFIESPNKMYIQAEKLALNQPFAILIEL